MAEHETMLNKAQKAIADFKVEHYSEIDEVLRENSDKSVELHKSSHVVNTTQRAKGMSQKYSDIGVVVSTPNDINDASSLISYLKDGDPVIVDLAGVEQTAGQRIIDFLVGITFSLSGDYHALSDKTFIFIPKNAFISNFEIPQKPDNKTSSSADEAKAQTMVVS